MTVSFVQVTAATGSFAVPVDETREVRAAADLRQLPDARYGVAGYVEHEGVPVPVLEALGRQGEHVLVVAGDELTFGLLVERVVGVFKVDELEIEPPPEGQRLGLIRGLVHHAGELVLIIDPAALATRLNW